MSLMIKWWNILKQNGLGFTVDELVESLEKNGVKVTVDKSKQVKEITRADGTGRAPQARRLREIDIPSRTPEGEEDWQPVLELEDEDSENIILEVMGKIPIKYLFKDKYIYNEKDPLLRNSNRTTIYVPFRGLGGRYELEYSNLEDVTYKIINAVGFSEKVAKRARSYLISTINNNAHATLKGNLVILRPNWLVERTQPGTFPSPHRRNWHIWQIEFTLSPEGTEGHFCIFKRWIYLDHDRFALDDDDDGAVDHRPEGWPPFPKDLDDYASRGGLSGPDDDNITEEYGLSRHELEEVCLTRADNIMPIPVDDYYANVVLLSAHEEQWTDLWQEDEEQW